MKVGTFRQKATISNASPAQIYQMLMDSKKHSEFTGDTAKISAKVGGNYTAYSGYITGKILELKENEKIVKSWRAVDGVWPEDHESIVYFEFEKSGKNTVIHFKHQDVPVNQVDEFKKGWKNFYWDLLKKYFQK
jgi:activator of HSP90 ATPase